MSITVSLHHKTTYRYDGLVRLAPHVVRLRPAPHTRTPILAYSLKVSPKDHFLNWQQDPFGNYQAHLVFTKEARELELEVDLVAELTAMNPFDFSSTSTLRSIPSRYTAEEKIALAPYLILLPSTGAVDRLPPRMKKDIARPKRKTIDVLVDINATSRICLRYEIRMEPGVFLPDDTLGARPRLVPRLRLADGAAGAAPRVRRAVRVGHSIQLKADVKALDGPQGVAEDATDLHAWAEIFLPGAGWIGFDATSGLLCAEGHLPWPAPPIRPAPRRSPARTRRSAPRSTIPTARPSPSR